MSIVIIATLSFGAVFVYIVLYNILERYRSPLRFFKTRKGLQVSDGFDRVIRHSFTVNQLKLDDFILVTDVPVRSLFDFMTESGCLDVLIIRELIEAQFDGKCGPLITNGETNIFFIYDYSNNRVTMVDVYWSKHNREWQINHFNIDALENIHKGTKVFFDYSD